MHLSSYKILINLWNVFQYLPTNWKEKDSIVRGEVLLFHKWLKILTNSTAFYIQLVGLFLFRISNASNHGFFSIIESGHCNNSPIIRTVGENEADTNTTPYRGTSILISLLCSSVYTNALHPYLNMSSRRITALNNIGIKNLQRGFFAEAVRSFRMAMECLNASLEQQDDEMSMRYYDERIQEQGMPLYAVPIVSVNATTILHSSPHNALDVYKTAFGFPTMKSMNFLKAEFSAILFYNLAISHHLAGLALAENSAENLSQAIQYYKLAMAIFKTQSDLTFATTCFAMVLGVLTNMGHVFSHFGCVQQASACIRNMEGVLESAVPALTEEEEDFFCSAVTFNQAQQAMPAPAA